MSEAERVRALATRLAERGLDRLLVTGSTNVRYLTGFSGSNGVALLSAEERNPNLFVTDFRYETQSAEQVDPLFERVIAPAELLPSVQERLSAELGGGGPRKLAFEERALTVAQHTRLRELLDERWELVPGGGLVEELREVKDEREIARIHAAAQLADEALSGLLEGGIAGRAEREVAIELELRMRRLGASAASFPSIVAAGPHGALPHAEPRDEPIPRDALVTIDWGATLDGYCSDCTRTYATGTVSGRAREVYELVLCAQQTALDAVRAGLGGRQVDAVARTVIDAAGYGERFGHGLGHGVGMEVHEAPRLSRTAGDDPLRAGNVVTVEPGIYLPGELGVRIEDLVVLGESGHRTLTGLPKALTSVD